MVITRNGKQGERIQRIPRYEPAVAGKKGGMREDNDQRGGARAAAKRGDGNQDRPGARNDCGEAMGG